MTTAADARERGGRPRNPELDRAILDAAAQLLAEEGYERMSIESVAHRAGVGKPTIYRRWSSKQAMVIDALARLNDGVEIPGEGSVRDRLTTFLERLWREAAKPHSDRMPVLSHLMGEIHRSPELREAVRSTFVAERRRRVQALLREGIENGEIDPSVDVGVVTDMALSPLVARKLLMGGKISPGEARSIVDVLFDGCAPARTEQPSA